MFTRISRFLSIRLGKISPEELTVQSCLEKGMKVGNNCHGLAACTIDYAHCLLIEIGENVTFAPQVYLLAHDASTKRHLDYTKIAKIKIGNNVFVGARALIMPGVTIGENAIIAAGSIVTKSVPPGTVVGGNPARVLANTTEYLNKHEENMEQSHVYDEAWTIWGNITSDMRHKMSEDIDGKMGYVK